MRSSGLDAYLAEDRDQWRALMKKLMNIRVAQKARNYLPN
jgi:hypothetical protein